MGLTTALWVSVALLTKPDPEALLRSFHQRARPMGWWAPFAEKNGTSRSIALQPLLRGIGIACVGTAATALLILGLTHAWFGRYAFSLLSLVTSAVLFLAFRKWTHAFLNFLTLWTGDNDIPASSVQSNLESKIK